MTQFTGKYHTPLLAEPRMRLVSAGRAGRRARCRACRRAPPTLRANFASELTRLWCPQKSSRFRRQISCESLANYSLVRELTLISSNATIQENVAASFKPCDYKVPHRKRVNKHFLAQLPICQQAPQFPSVQFNNLVYMRALVLSLASLFVLIPT